MWRSRQAEEDAVAESLRQAVEAVPEASWTTSNGEQLTSREIINQWPAERLQQSVEYGEDEMGMTTIRAQGGGQILLTMLGPSGPDILPPPVTRA